MRFERISITKKAVDLQRSTTDGNGATEDVHTNTPERPNGSFTDAMQAFVPFVVKLLAKAITLAKDEKGEAVKLTVTTLNLSEDKNGLRQLIVTATVPVPDAYDKPLVLNTPLVREAGELPLGDAIVLDDDMMKLIALVELEAEKFVNGERLPAAAAEPKAEKKTSANAKEFDEAAAHAEVQSTRKPKGRKGKAAEGTPLSVM
jgi:hypothetical protein